LWLGFIRLGRSYGVGGRFRRSASAQGLQHIGPLSLGFQLAKRTIELLLQVVLVGSQFLEQCVMYRGV